MTSTAALTDPRSGRPEQVGEALREAITAGRLTPGSRLAEESLVLELGVSRNTLREAFRLLAHDGLLEHRLHQGTFVPLLGAGDLVDLYRLRLLIEPHVVRDLTQRHRHHLGPVEAAVKAGERACQDNAWSEVITANMAFHQELVALGESPRMDGLIRRVLAEMRLIFALVPDPQPLYQPYVAQNRVVFQGLHEGDFTATADYLDGYLRRSEAALQDALGWT